MQQPLDYQTPPRYAPHTFGAPTAVTLLTAFYNAETEPFGEFDVWDAVIHVGSLVLAVGLWAYWALRAYRESLSAIAVSRWLLGRCC